MTGNRHLQVGRTSVAFIMKLTAVSALGSKGSPEEPCVCGLPSAQLSTPLLLHRTGTGCVFPSSSAPSSLYYSLRMFTIPSFLFSLLSWFN